VRLVTLLENDRIADHHLHLSPTQEREQVTGKAGFAEQAEPGFLRASNRQQYALFVQMNARIDFPIFA
jgi:hypothetical protein